MRATSKLRELLGTGKTLFVPGCYNALSGKILETVGFPAVYMTVTARRSPSSACPTPGSPP